MQVSGLEQVNWTTGVEHWSIGVNPLKANGETKVCQNVGFDQKKIQPICNIFIKKRDTSINFALRRRFKLTPMLEPSSVSLDLLSQAEM